MRRWSAAKRDEGTCAAVHPSAARPGAWSRAGFLFLVVARERGAVELDTGTGSAMGFLSLGGLGESIPACVRVPGRDVDPDCLIRLPDRADR